MGTVDKGTIDELIVPHLSRGKRGFKLKVSLSQVVLAIFYRLKTGCQWRELPFKQFTDTVAMSWRVFIIISINGAKTVPGGWFG